MAQNVDQSSLRGDLRWKLEGLRWSVGFSRPSLNLCVAFQYRVAMVEAVHERLEEVMNGVEDRRGIFVEWEVLQLWPDMRVNQTSTLQISPEVVSLELTGAFVEVSVGAVFLRRLSIVWEDGIDCSSWREEDDL